MVDFSEIRQQRGQLATAQQRRAANPVESVWVEASAGTGKTKVLSDRVLRLLLNGVPPAKILCLTYTKAAAVEMSNRIAKRLSEWAIDDEETLAKELKKLLGELPDNLKDYTALTDKARQLFALLMDTPGGMKIQTIHSFCQGVLSRFPLEAKVSPYFSILDDRCAAEAIADVQSELLAKIESEPDSAEGQALAYLTERVEEDGFADIMKNIAADRNKIIRLFAKYSSIDEVIADLAERLDVCVDDDEEKLLQAFWQNTDWANIRKIMEALSHGLKTDCQNAAVLAGFLSGENRDFDQYARVFIAKTTGNIQTASKPAVAFWGGVDDCIQLEAQRINSLKRKRISLRVFLSTKAVIVLALALINGYMRYKHLHSKLDFQDVVVLTRHLLESSDVAQWVMYKLDGGIDAVLIDEAQDTSPDQWAIIKALTEEFFAGIGNGDAKRTVFVVGDRKQSIYSFQGADPDAFETMRQYFKSADENFQEVHLDVSFRSTSAVLESVNKVFENPIAKDGVVLSGDAVKHLPFRMGEAGKVEIWPLLESKEGEKNDAWRPPVERVDTDSASVRLAQSIARKIKHMVQSGEILESQNRPIQYGDFMVLVRRRNDFADDFVRACKAEGVEIAGIDKIKLIDQIAIQDLLGIGKFLLLPTDDLTLAEILKSPMWGLDDDDLIELCYGRRNKPLWTRLEENPKYKAVYDELKNLADMADFVRPFELYSYILGKMDGRRKFVERMGDEVTDGIDEFINKTLAFEQEYIPSLQAFVDWMSHDNVEVKREQEQSGANSVRIMTVHGSKGLQAPIVIMPDTVGVPMVKKEGMLLWDEMMFYPLEAADYDDVCTEINADMKSKSLREYRRLLYVALTRAEDRLYICGFKGKNKINDDAWYALCEKNLAEVSENGESENIVISSSQDIDIAQKKSDDDDEYFGAVEVVDESWMHNPALPENPLAKPYTPSRPDDEDEEPAMLSPISKGDEKRYYRGRVIHKLLQFLPDVCAEDKGLVIENFLQNNAPELSAAAKNQIKNEVLRLLHNEAFAKLFGKNSKAEVPVMGEVEGKIISGQIDRLAVDDDEVLIVDFKTNRPAALNITDVPTAYLKQLRAYQQLLAKIYPQKAVRCFILWTDTAVLMPIC